MPPVSVLVKPASSLCNMSCKYCFYRELSNQRKVGSRGIMSLETANILIDRIFSVCTDTASIAFQGGEPLLAGIGFFQNFVDAVKERNTKHIGVNYSLQTNGMLIDDAFCRFFRDNHFLVGVSLDGEKDIHNALRDGGKYADIVKRIHMLEKYGVEYNVLTVVTKSIARHCEKVYKNLTGSGFRYLQFIPCLYHFDGAPPPYAVDAKQYGDFLVRLYALWRSDCDRGAHVYVRNIDNVLSVLTGRRAEICTMQGHCSMQNVVEADGTVYPCDFYCSDEFALGNIKADGWEKLFQNAGRFLADAPQQNAECAACRFFSVCRGGCKREYAHGRNVFCEAYQVFFSALMNE